MSVTDVGGDKRIFLRKASGLIRTAGLTDTFIYNLGVVRSDSVWVRCCITAPPSTLKAI